MIYRIADGKPDQGLQSFFFQVMPSVHVWLNVLFKDKANRLNLDKLNATIQAADLILKNSLL